MSARAKDHKKNSTAEVLYQRLGDKWYAFSVMGDEVFFGEVPDKALDEPAEDLSVGSHEDQATYSSKHGHGKTPGKSKDA